jgi:hypothetical protein
MAMLDMLIQLRQYYGHVRCIGTGRRYRDLVMSARRDNCMTTLGLLIQLRQRCTHLRYSDRVSQQYANIQRLRWSSG